MRAFGHDLYLGTTLFSYILNIFFLKIQKYQSTIDMMTKLKQDLEKELEAELKSKESKSKSKNLKNVLASATVGGYIPSNQEYQIRSQIKHLDDQIKCVAFLLMQCQIGLENCSDNFANNLSILNSNNDSTPTQETLPNSIEIPKICIDQVENDGNKKL